MRPALYLEIEKEVSIYKNHQPMVRSVEKARARCVIFVPK